MNKLILLEMTREALLPGLKVIFLQFGREVCPLSHLKNI
jgi:hypothetical protein